MMTLENFESYTTTWQTLDDCREFAQSLASKIYEPVCIALVGTLGAGKTQFVRFFVEAMQGSPADVSSPTFVLVHLYHARLPIAHLDLYRLQQAIELESFGFDDLVYGEYVSLVEWANKFPEALPAESLWLSIDAIDTQRTVTLQANIQSPALSIVQSFKRM